MSYSTSKLKTVAECTQAISIANSRKSDLQFEQTSLTRSLTDKEKNTDLANSNLISINAQITGTDAAIAALSEGEAKEALKNKLRRLNDRKENLEERLQRGGAIALLDTELETSLISLQLTEIDNYIAEVETRKAAL